MYLPPIVVEGGLARRRSCPTPVGIGSPDDIVAVLFDILVLDLHIGWQRDSRFLRPGLVRKPEKSQLEHSPFHSG